MSKKKKDELTLKSKEELEKEVKKDLKKFITEQKKLSKNKVKNEEEEKIADLDLQTILASAALDQEKDIERVRKMTGPEKIEWILDKHQTYVASMNLLFSSDFLNGTDSFDRYCIIVYMQELINLLETYNIEFDNEMIKLLVEKGEVELLAILNVFNYL